MDHNFDKNWKFYLEKEPYAMFPLMAGKCGEAQGYAADVFNDTGWETVDLPHDWAYRLPMEEDFCVKHGHYKVSNLGGYNSDPFTGARKREASIGWYRKRFQVPEGMEDKLAYLIFDGVYRDCMIWVNGAYVDRHLSGYTGFTFEISDLLRYDGINTIAVRVDASEQEGWWYEGAGIYRHVYLEYRNRLHVERDSVQVCSQVDGSVQIKLSLSNANETEKEAVLKFAIHESSKGAEQGMTQAKSVEEEALESVREIRQLVVKVPSFEQVMLEISLQIEKPVLWDVDHPYLYEAQISVACEDEETDRVCQTFGIRSITFDPDKGFFLNGRSLQLRGACVHQDFACVGTALPDDIHEYKLRKLKEVGVNAYRTSHNPPAPELLEACDRLGMLVMDETRMFGSSPEMLRQLEALVRRDRNHPSVILWSIGNEEHSVQSNDRGRRMAKTMMQRIHKLDETRPITFGGNNGIDYEGINECVDVRGFNYLHIRRQDYLEKYHELHPKQPLIGSEEASCIYTRGETATDFMKKTVTSYDEYVMSWGSTAEGWLKYYHNHPYIAGGFLWTGFDYSGEPVPYLSNTVTNFGIMDLCGYPKDIFYYYQAWWTRKPVLYLFPDWNRLPGELVRVVVYSNADEVELLVNGRSLGRQQVTYLGHLEWQVPFEAGCIEAAAWKDGTLVKRFARHTAGTPYKLQLKAENAPFTGSTALVTAELLDEAGNPVPYADQEIHFTCENGKILGVGNGDPGSYEPNYYEPIKVSRALKDWKTEAGDVFDVNEPASGRLFTYEFRDVAAEVPVIEPFCDLKRIVLTVPRLENRERILCTSFEDEGGQALLEFGRIEAEACEIILNGDSVAQFKKSAFPQAFEVCTRAGLNQLEVKLATPDGQGRLCQGVALTRFMEPEWKRKAFHGLCMVMVKRQGNTVIRAFGEGLKEAELVLPK